MKYNPFLLAAAGAVLLAGCTANDARQNLLPATMISDTETVRNMQPTGKEMEAVMKQPANGTSFNAWLSRDYKGLMLFEVDRMSDYVSADMYAKRSLAAARGETVTPLQLNQFDLPEAHLPALTEARANLVDMLGKGAPTRFPREAAFAQSRFDCWVEQQEENHQPYDIARCRDEFVGAMNDLRGKMAPAPAPAPTAAAPTFQDSYTVLFDFDESTITPAANATLTQALRAMQQQNAGASIIGYTDTVGSPAYNQALSERRARAVADLFLAGGVRPAVLTTEGKGETELAQPTADGVRDAANRRAVINIR
jgi:OmpA-OmpF porin, OOP family